MEFTHGLPAIRCEGRDVGNYNNPEIEYPCLLNTTEPKMGLFIEALRDAIRNERRLVVIDNKVLMCCHNWIRDCYYMAESFIHWEHDLHSFYDFLLENQHEKGYFYELIKQLTDWHWKMVDDDCRKLYPEDSVAAVRLELEADVEYEMVLYADLVYKVEGDLDYIEKILPRLEKSIDYMTSDEKRWDEAHGLVKRMYTIDMWDFTNDESSNMDRRIYPDRMCIMHGDNSGVYAAMQVLAKFNRKLGRDEKAAEWEQRAETLKANMIKHLWNGKFFIHQLPLTAKPLDDNENIRLSLSNAYDMNRGVTTVEQSRSIIEEYMSRRKTTDAFAEWFSIDPPYESFKDYKPGFYVNGSISPFTAGELALAAFENGYEEYGYDILRRFKNMWERDQKISFLYARDGVSVSDGQGPSGWGSSSLLKAYDRGLAGLEDLDCRYRVLGFSPRFAVTEYTETRFMTGYEKTHTHVDVRYELKDDTMHYLIVAPSVEIKAHILLPKGKKVKNVTVNGRYISFALSVIGESVYADFDYSKESSEKSEIIINLE